MISLSRVTVAYPDAMPLDRVSVEISESPVAIVGPSGSGKTTLLRLLAGHQVADEGSVSIDGVPVAHPTWTSAGDPRVATIHQDYRLVPFLSIGDNLRLAAEVRGRRTSGGEVVEALHRVGLDVPPGRFPASLSGGEQQRVTIARALISGAAVLLADEPTGALDAANTDVVADLLVEIGRTPGLTVVVASHDERVVARLGTAYALSNGRMERRS